MSKYLKNSFHRRALFDNKYAEQSYIAYLSKNKRKYIMNSSDWVDRYIVITIDFIFRFNNAICRRGLVKNNIEDIKKLYSKEIKDGVYYYYGKTNLKQIFNSINVNNLDNEYKIEIYNMLKTIMDWEYKLENNYDEFKGIIYNLIKTIDEKHYVWVVGENIVYNRSIRDNITKKYHCYVIGNKGYNKFKKVYYNNVYLQQEDKEKTFEEVCDLLIILADIYNELIIKEYDNAKTILSDYLEENIDMIKSKDIYYAKIYDNLKQLLPLLNNNKNTDVMNIIKDILLNENKKYKKDLLMYENISIDEKDIEQGNYFEL